jgi:putative ABC transport system substrate-binding protein
VREKMNKKVIGLALVTVLLAFVFPAEAQQAKKVPRIGYLIGASTSSYAARTEAFRQGLREFGYVEGKNISFEYRSAEGKPDGLPELAAALVRLTVDVIVTGGGPSVTHAAKEATVTIPIVMANDGDPVGNGFVASLARPGGNITGFSTLTPEISGKRMELLKETVPKLSRVAVLGTSTSSATAPSLKEVELAAGAFGAKLQFLNVLGPEDIETAFRAATKGRADAVLVIAGPFFPSQQKQVADLAAKSGSQRYTPFQNL